MEPSTYPDARVPTRIGRYQDLHILGRGGMGAVYRAYDPELDRPVALKVMLHSTSDFIARFRREAQSIARLTHPNVVQVFDFGVDTDDNPYFVMELVDGTPLDRLLKERGRLPVADAMEIARQAALGLAAAHRAGIIHRDIKPSNLIIDARGGVKIVDFGIARSSSGAQLTNAASLMGTPGYMAPEQAQGKTVDLRADIYSLGLTLFEMLAGAPPFVADDPIALVVMNIQEPLPKLGARTLGVPEKLISLVEGMAVKDPAGRVQNCETVVRALEEMLGIATAPQLGVTAPSVAADSAPSVPPLQLGPTVASDGQRRTALFLGVALAVAGVGVAGVLLLVPKKPTTKALVVEPSHASTHDSVVDEPEKRPTPSVAEGAELPVLTSPVLKAALKVAVLKFQNLSHDPQLDALAIGIGETAVSDMSGVASGRMALIERADIDSDIGEIDRGKDEHFDKATMARAGLLRGVDVVVQGGYQKSGKQLRITARFVRVETGEVLDTLRIDGKAREVLALQDEVAKALRGHLIALVDRERPAILPTDRGTK